MVRPMDNTCDDDVDGDILLPHDVLIQILVCLPVISLLRFKSVCKSWRTLIDSSFFIHLHATTTLQYSSSSKFGTFVFQTLYPAETLMLSAASRSPHGDNDDKEDMVCEVKSLGFPTHYKVIPRRVIFQEILMVGSCNGLICLRDSVLRDVSLWNPATKQFRILPKSLTLEEGIGDFKGEFVAFGFDIKTKDYKVVQITWFQPYNNAWVPRDKYAYRIQVYNLSTNSWRLLDGINSLPALPLQGLGMNHGLYLNGSYIFLGTYIDYLILSFDFTKEIFTTVQLPDQHNYDMFFLTYLGEKIACFATGKSDDIWVLNEHGGVKESWTKLHSNVRRDLRVEQWDSWNKIFTPRGISNNGEFAFIETRVDGERKLGLFNLVTKEAKKVLPIGSKKVVRVDVYKPSLVSVIGGNGASTAAGRFEPPPLLVLFSSLLLFHFLPSCLAQVKSP